MRPRPYLSWTQLSVWENSPERYKRIYIDGEDSFHNDGTDFGKIVADALENDGKTESILTDFIVSSVPKFDSMEFPIEGTLNGVPLFGKIDSFNSKTKRGFKEYKTGRHPWTQKKVDEHGQLTFYCSLIQAKYGLRPEGMDIELIYIPTEYNPEGVIEPTGEKPLRFKTRRTMIDVMRMSARQKKAWEGIGKLSIEEMSKL